MDTRRDQIIDIVKREFIGPDPINVPGLIQENGEEILSSDPPRIRYIAGILFPQKTVQENNTSDNKTEEIESEEFEQEEFEDKEFSSEKGIGRNEVLQDAEELLNLSNSFQQSAISITAAVRSDDEITVKVSAGIYITVKDHDPDTEKERIRYHRSQITWDNNGAALILPDKGIKKYTVTHNGYDTGLCFAITYRYSKDGKHLYTFTLENTKISEKKDEKDIIRDEDCFFQVQFSLYSQDTFTPLPENEKLNYNDNDYLSNRMMYRNVKGYAVGHGCAASWDDEKAPDIHEIRTSIFPTYEIKPIVPARINGISLEMYKLSDYGSKEYIINELKHLCHEYENWIKSLNNKLPDIDDKGTASRHITACNECLRRMTDGVKLLEENEKVLLAFQLMNRAMLLQQLHYNLPLQTWTTDEDNNLYLENPVRQLPDIRNPETWYQEDPDNKRTYGIWRPFQLAFVLINLRSMYQRDSDDRRLVDLIWFPTGGGKTEAYLGLSAYTIFIRRLLDKNNSGTTILMRYTLRLLTSQQYERASSMICACETIRKEKEELLGTDRISIGLWVGGETSPNKMSDAVIAYDKLYNGRSDSNPFVMLKCPWCGAQMGMVRKSGRLRETPGYKKIVEGRSKRIVFQCSNSAHHCEFSQSGNELPLYIVDEDIYEKAPTLLLGTVDKFAMLPYRPEAQAIFGLKNGDRITAPDLIIQDELHLISGPLGSMVGHYETMINELSSYKRDNKTIKPKIIASTATISRANEQCNALYCCGKENVRQFPPSGLDAGDSFFAVEDKSAVGRQYVGILANASTSVATTTIRLYAALLYAAKAIKVDKESERDGYWTNVGYFNSIRELGQTETWIKADIDEYLHVIYKRRYEDKLDGYRENRRYIWEDEELTSRISSDKIPSSLQKLSIRYPTGKDEKKPVDICLATNMISVGVDVPRLGLMTVSGQPKTTSEYIQATSRVGRDKNVPGLVFTIYNPGKPRDKSHYEHFETYHSRVYCSVEPTSVTPFSAPLRERALHALIIGIMRLEGDNRINSDPPQVPNSQTIEKIKNIISDRINAVDPEEMEETLRHIDSIIENWELWEPRKFQDFTNGDELPLMFPSGNRRNEAWGKSRGFETPTSMRSVDASCEVYVIENGYHQED